MNEISLSDLAKRINRGHEKFVGGTFQALEGAFEAGSGLNESKRVAYHGTWESWVDKECKFSYRMARKYMLFAARIGPEGISGNWPSAANFPEGISGISLDQALAMLAAPDELDGKSDKKKDCLPGQTRFLDHQETFVDEDEDLEEVEHRPSQGIPRNGSGPGTYEKPDRPEPEPKSKFDVLEEEFKRRSEQWSVFMNTVGMHGGIVALSEAWHWSEPTKDQMAMFFGAISREFGKYSKELKERDRQ